jgi:hypothetical protein
MAEQAKRTDVVEVALPSALSDWEDVIGIPQAATTGDGFHSVEAQTSGSSGSASTLQRRIGCHGVDLTDGAAAAVASEDLITEIARVGAQTPLMNAVVAAECTAAFAEDLKIAPAAQRQAIWAFGERAARCTAAGKRAGRKHGLLGFEDRRKREFRG